MRHGLGRKCGADGGRRKGTFCMGRWKEWSLLKTENWRKTVLNCKCVSGFKERGNNLFKYMVGRSSNKEFKLKQGRFKLA